MKSLFRAVGALLAFSLPLAVSAAGTTTPATNDAPFKALPYSPGLDLDSMDRKADPCEDFYQYSCGGWMQRNPIPADQSSWSVYGKLYDDNQRFLWGILADLASRTDGRSSPQQKIGDYFAACMDQATVEKRDLEPLKAQLASIDSLKDESELPSLLAQLHMQGVDALFGFSSSQDLENSQSVIAFVSARGLGLPDRDYYFRTDTKSVEQRSKYTRHVEHMLSLLGDTPEQAKAESGDVIAIETALADSSLTVVQKRDPHAMLHKTTLAGLGKITPHFDWSRYLAAVGLTAPADFNMNEPAFLAAVDTQLSTRRLAQIKSYLRWHLINDNAPYLSSRFVNENFDFYGRTLRGSQQLKPRWKRCVTMVDQELGEALGQEYVARVFTPEMKNRTVAMTVAIEKAMQEDLEHLDWMSPETRQNALTKLHATMNKVGYPDRWRDYSSVDIRRDDFVGNTQRTEAFEMHRMLAKIGKPLDRGEWGMTPPTVNAYYDPQMNDINFPAGVLQPPLYDAKMDDAPNYGNTGGTIGHELTHAFDDEGRQFDAKGDLRDWWKPQDADQFQQRAQCVVDQYGKYPVIDDLHINSKLTEGEDIADLGGLILAYIAWKTDTQNQALKSIDGLTPDQRFFVGYAQWACENVRPESLRERTLTNPHSPGRYRVNGVVANVPEFQKAFSCKASSPMVNPKPCRVW
jgi:endothelin-converting enzyme/putative endopeptidase